MLWLHYTIGLKSAAKSEDVKRQALLMYLEGLRFYSTGRILKVSHVSVLSMIRKYGREVEAIRRYKPVITIELDGSHTCVGHKNYRWIWTCVS